MFAAQADIARRFSQAAAGYDQAATIQRLTRAHLYAFNDCAAHGQIVADIGSGSGVAAAHWQQQGAQVLALDVASGMLQHSRHLGRGHVWIAADAEALPLADTSVDICFSNLALQWCANQAQAWREIFRVLKPGGTALVSSLADGSMQPLRAAWAAADHQPHSHHFVAQADLQTAVAALPWQSLHSEAHTETLHFPDLKTLLQSLRQVGANHVAARSQGLTGKQKWRLFAEAYAQYGNEQGRLPLEYRVVYWCVRK